MKRLALLLFFTISAHASTISLGDYAAALTRIHTALSANDLATARNEATQLRDDDIAWTHGRLAVDETLLDAVAHARGRDPQLLGRLGLTINELRAEAGAVSAADPKLLAEVAAAQEVPELAAGGDVQLAGGGDAPLLERIASSIGRMLQWLGQKVLDFIRWLIDLFPRNRSGEQDTTAGMRWLVIGVAILIALTILILAIRVLRSARRGSTKTSESLPPIGSARDEDPLSRGATEWERYAIQLAESDRYREAIRAWYHAVLVTCYASGVLHFRKGRTNWEYVAALSPSIPWRPEMIELTRRFEWEWYGHEQSTEEAFDDCSDRARRILDALHARGAA